jgi:hypothetical protein
MLITLISVASCDGSCGLSVDSYDGLTPRARDVVSSDLLKGCASRVGFGRAAE